MRSFSLLKTNVALTSNVKITVDSDDNLYLDTINSNQVLSNNNFKKFAFDGNSNYDTLLKNFWNDLSPENVFFVRDEEDNTIMFDKFEKQIDDLYISGCDDVTDNKFYEEDFEYFAPLYVSKTGLPKFFAIFRLDGAGILNLTKNNFKSIFLNRLKCVEIKDLTTNTQLGKWLDLNVINNDSFPNTGFEIDFRNLQFSYWNGVDYTKGIWTKSPFIFDDILDYENTFSDLEKFITEGFKTSKIIYPNILNLNFLFDDTPATPTSLRTWSMNRYAGFYLDDMIYSTSIATYLPSVVVSDCEILQGNILTSTFNKPFTDATLEQKDIFIEVEGNYYKVINVPVNIAGFETNQWIILSDKDLTGKQSLINKNIITIDTNNKISYSNGNSFVINDWNTADLWLIKIGNKYHTLQYSNGDYYIYSDYAFSQNQTTLNYYINYPDPTYNYTLDLLTGNYWTASNVITNNPDISLQTFPIYKLQFSDIKYFDESIVETKFANHQYELHNEVIQTDEPKMHMTDLGSKYFPRQKVDFIVDSLVTNIPSASHYSANNETFRVIQNQDKSYDLSHIWKKNAQSLKWGFKNSISSNDYPYYLNNSFNAEIHNKCANLFLNKPSRVDRNLEHFYTINSSTASWLYHSLHIEEIQNGSIVQDYSFDAFEYLNLGYDYFSLFFDRKVYHDNSTIIENVAKFSYFNTGDSTIPNITNFNGLKVKVFDVNSVKISNGLISSLNLLNNNTYDDYKFAILMSKNSWTIETDTTNINKISITSSTNNMQWSVVDAWKLEKQYNLGDIVNFNEILYTALTASNITDPTLNPSNNSGWTYSNVDTIFFSPTKTYMTYDGSFGPTLSNIVYNFGDYYYNNGVFVGSNNTFYTPGITYNINDIIIYQNSVWQSTTSSNTTFPTSYVNNWTKIGFYDSYNDPTTQWSQISLWDSFTSYIPGDLIIYNNVLYYANSITTIGVTPDSTIDWNKLYTIYPDTYAIYGTTPDSNNLLYFNNRYYICISNSNNSTLDNGIYVFVNNKYKNIFVNIYINDNTLGNLSNTERDNLYSDIYTNLTANNFITAINDVQNNYGFINKIKYIVFDDVSTKIYDFNQVNSFINLPTLLQIDTPDLVKSRFQSLVKTAVTLKPNQIKPTFALSNGDIPTLSKRNYFNKIHLASVIDKSTSDPAVIPNYSGLTNNIYNELYRHSGYYDPIFLTVDLFKKGLTYSTRTIFDTDLTNFGVLKHKIVSKINRNGSQLKLKNTPSLRSVYPMLDEFGLTTKDIFIFKSNWDFEYFTECTPAPISIQETIVDTPVIFNPISIPPNNLL